jgi:hypothetical protein
MGGGSVQGGSTFLVVILDLTLFRLIWYNCVNRLK